MIRLAKFAQPNLQDCFYFLSHNVGLCLCEHTKDDDGSTALLVGNFLVMTVNLPKFLDHFIRNGDIARIGHRVRNDRAQELLQRRQLGQGAVIGETGG